MLIATWIVSGVLAALNLLAGAGKAFTPWAALSEKMPWTQTTGKGRAYLAAWAEIVGAIGVIVPNVLAHTIPGWEWARWVSVAAALGLALIQILAIQVHRSRKEPVQMNLVLATLGVAAAILIALT
jgi:hypothetical protein